ncbi:MAG: magnesium protoporphyrin IX methyltransferase [Beijerinckiaceae bacterium]
MTKDWVRLRADVTYQQRRNELEAYFDRTAVKAWERLTSNAPVSRVRATVRAGRDEMRARLMSWLPDDLRGARVFDAGCGTGALAVEAAKRGADVLAVDISPTLIGIAAERLPPELGGGRISFKSGDMLDPAYGRFNHVVAMDSLIHYPAADIVRVLAALAERTDRSIVFTVAPRTPLLAAMHAAGKLFPRGDRSPAIEPIAERDLRRRIAMEPSLRLWSIGRTERISRGFYISQAMELVRP